MKQTFTTYDAVYQPFTSFTVENGEVTDTKCSAFMLPQKEQRLIFQDKAVICFLNAGTDKEVKGVAKCMDTDEYDELKGIKIAYLKAKIKEMTKELKKLSK